MRNSGENEEEWERVCGFLWVFLENASGYLISKCESNSFTISYIFQHFT